jgi:hypothetical protein
VLKAVGAELIFVALWLLPLFVFFIQKLASLGEAFLEGAKRLSMGDE